MRRTSKHGTTYSAGSHQSWADFPRVCHGCGERVVMRREHVWQETLENGAKRSWHMRCRLGAIEDAA